MVLALFCFAVGSILSVPLASMIPVFGRDLDREIVGCGSGCLSRMACFLEGVLVSAGRRSRDPLDVVGDGHVADVGSDVPLVCCLGCSFCSACPGFFCEAVHGGVV